MVGFDCARESVDRARGGTVSRTARAPDGKGSALGAARRTREYAFRPGAEAPFGASQRATFDDQRIPLEVPVGVAGEVARERQRAGCLRAVVLGGRRAPSHRRERERAPSRRHGVRARRVCRLGQACEVTAPRWRASETWPEPVPCTPSEIEASPAHPEKTELPQCPCRWRLTTTPYSRRA